MAFGFIINYLLFRNQLFYIKIIFRSTVISWINFIFLFFVFHAHIIFRIRIVLMSMFAFLARSPIVTALARADHARRTLSTTINSPFLSLSFPQFENDRMCSTEFALSDSDFSSISSPRATDPRFSQDSRIFRDIKSLVTVKAARLYRILY